MKIYDTCIASLNTIFIFKIKRDFGISSSQREFLFQFNKMEARFKD